MSGTSLEDTFKMLNENDARYFSFHSKEDLHILACMNGAGFVYVNYLYGRPDSVPKQCDASKDHALRNPFCYAPRGRLKNLLFQLEVKLGFSN